MTTGNLLLLVVLAALLGLCSCDCDGFDTDTERSQRCALIYDVLEEALVSNKVNLYRLREAFLSSTHRNPAWLTVKYMLTNDNESVIQIWSSSTANILFLELLQPGLLTLFFHEEKIGPFPEMLSLTLDVDSLIASKSIAQNEPTDFSVIISQLHKSTAVEWKYALATLTTRLKAYARAQGKLGSWDGSDRGYTWTEIPSVDPSMLSASLLLMLSALGLSIKFTPHLLTSLREEANQHTRPVTGLFWSLAFLTFTYNSASLPADLLLLTFSCPAFHTVCALKVAVMLLSVAVGIAWMLRAYCLAMALPPLPIKCLSRFLYSFAFFNVSFSICNLAGTIIPTFLLATVYPTEVLSTAALMCAVVFCFVSILAVPFAHKKTVNISERRRAISSLCNVILLSLFLMSVVLVLILYLKTIRQSNDLLSIVLSFLPSALLTAVGFVIRKKLFNKNQPHQKSMTDQQSHNGDTELLTLAEEGSQAPAEEEQDQPSVKDE